MLKHILEAMDRVETLELLQESTRQTAVIENAIVKIRNGQLAYNEFFWNYMQQNVPIVFTNVSTDWECTKWTAPPPKDQNPALNNNNNNDKIVNINFNYLKAHIENNVVPVADCNNIYFNSHKKIEMQFYQFLHYWQNQQNENTNCNENKSNLYLKDWHLQAQMPAYRFYVVPKYFAADWLNEYLIANKRDDYRFVYMGPKDTWTPFHADVFGSFSWSTNIVGIKKWIFLPPEEERKLQDKLGNLPFNIDEHYLNEANVKYISLLQMQGEAVFVPSGWYHQVWNITDTISVNHNWFNACNLHRIWNNLNNNMEKVIAEIQDCREMDNFESHCQTMLRASFGINYLDFLDILEFIVEKRLLILNNDNRKSSSSKYLLFNNYELNNFHIQYDLRSVNDVVHAMLKDKIVCDSRVYLYRRCIQMFELTKNI